MRKTWNAFLGVILILAGAGGMIFSAAGIGSLWYFKPSIQAVITRDLTLLQETLTTTSEGLVLVSDSIETTAASVRALEETIGDTAGAIRATTPMIATLAIMTREELPRTLETAQTSLSSAQESAQIIDGFLSALSFLPGIDYDPEVPLNEALASVSASLDPLPTNLKTIETSLEATEDNLSVVQSDIELIAADMSQISASLEESQGVIEQYQATTTDLEQRVEQALERLPYQVRVAAWALTFALVWFFFTQLGLVLQGMAMINAPG